MSQLNGIQMTRDLQSLQAHTNFIINQNNDMEKMFALQMERQQRLNMNNMSKQENIRSILEKIQNYIIRLIGKYQNLKNRQTKNIEHANLVISEKQKIITPNFDFQYILVEPEKFISLKEKIVQQSSYISSNKQKREEQIRTIKIKVALAEIQLKQLKNRSKKL